ncbi:MAG TPA: dihydroorotate dehydrogenase-like protein [Spirochaetia bacterium]|nr:dihydroorotate dehydrogenase-like protein [Spirochaetia bacterium]
MAALTTQFMGLALNNPIIAGACDLTSNMDSIKRIEQAGAGAIVLKSLFEEQIQLERYKLEEEAQAGENIYSEMMSIFPKMQHAGSKEHLMWAKKAKETVRIPVIASLNAVNPATWIEYAKQLADQGVDALELNFFATPRDFDVDSARVEDEQVETVQAIRQAIRIPLAVKLSLFYANPLHFISRLDQAGVNGFVLFNRFFQPDINTDSESMTLPFNFSEQVDNRLPLRFAGLLHGKIKADVCAATGIMTGKDVAKMILAGAGAVQVVTALYRNGVKSLTTMREELSYWMDSRSYGGIAAFQGKLSAGRAKDPWIYTRAQYAKMLLSPKEFSEPVKV